MHLRLGAVMSLLHDMQIRDWISLFSVTFAILVALLGNAQSLMRARLDNLVKQQLFANRLDDLTNRISSIEQKLEKLIDVMLRGKRED